MPARQRFQGSTAPLRTRIWGGKDRHSLALLFALPLALLLLLFPLLPGIPVESAADSIRAAPGALPITATSATPPALSSLVLRDPGLSPPVRLISQGRWQGETETAWLMEVCEGWQRTWRSGRNEEAQAVVWRCPDARDAASLVWFATFDPDFFRHPKNLPALPGVWLKPEVRYVSGAKSREALFAQGNRAAMVSLRTPAGDRSDELTGRITAMASSQASLLPGERAELREPAYVRGMSVLVTIPAVSYLVYILPWRMLRTWPVWRRYRVRRRDAAWRNVSGSALLLAAQVRVRAVFRVFGFFVLGMLIATRNLTIDPVVMLAIALAGGWMVPIGSRRLFRMWRPRPVRGRWDVRGRRAWAVRSCGLASLLLYAAGLALFFVFYIAQLSGLADSPLIEGGLPTARYLQVKSFGHLLAFVVLAVVGLGAGSAVIVVSGLLMVFGVLVRRLGRSYALKDAATAQDESDEPPVLYLRSFTDDSATMPSSAIARTSVLERASFAWRQPFEEITVRHVSALGPVIAASHPADTRRRADIGAARMRLGSHWQQEIEEMALRSRCVVVGATPEELNDGLLQELDLLGRHPTVPVVLVLAPLPRRQLEKRWQGFIDAAVARRGSRPRDQWRFDGLRDHRDGATGALLLLNTGGTEWRVWGATRRTEFTYAAAWGEARDVLSAGAQRLPNGDHAGAAPTRPGHVTRAPTSPWTR